MLRRPPRSPRTYTLFPYTTRFLSFHPCLRLRHRLSVFHHPADAPAAARPGTGGRTEGRCAVADRLAGRSEEHTSELQSLMRISYAVFCLKKKIPKDQ